MARVYNISQKRPSIFFGGLGVNITIILINVALFFAFTFLLASGVLSIDDVAIKPSNILSGNYAWTFLTSMFMHGGFFHLFANMLSLLFIGSLAGLFAGLFFVLASLIPIQFFSADFDAFAVGASGAIFGLVGLLMLLTPNLPVYVMFIPIPIKMKYAAPGILIVLWFISAAGNVPVGNTAHLGGLIAGLVYGFYLKYKFPNKTNMLSKHFS